MKYRLQLSGLFFVLLLTVTAWAHEGMQHVIGTVAKITESNISVETKDHKTVDVAITSSTEFQKGKEATPAKRQDVAVGDRVVIHAMPMKGQLTAHTVRFVNAAATNTK